MGKATVEEIRARFDRDVERFANLETGQTSTVDGPLVMDLIARTASAVNPKASTLLDVGCGAGNYSVKLCQYLPELDVTLMDLSVPMLDKARERVSAVTSGKVKTLQTDVRDFPIPSGEYDIIIAAAVLHHLRSDHEWQELIFAFYRALKPGGALWIADLVEHDHPEVQRLMWESYGDYLVSVDSTEYRDRVFDYIEREDTPKSLMYQARLMEKVGFTNIDILHKHSAFAAFGGVKPLS